MDKIDREILDILEEDGRASYTRIADEVDVSEATVRNRVKKMQEEGAIQRFTIEKGIESGLEAFISVNVSTERDFPDIISEMPEVDEIYELAGEIDLLVRVSAETSEKVNEKVDKIRKIEGVEDTSTHLVLSSS